MNEIINETGIINKKRKIKLDLILIDNDKHYKMIKDILKIKIFLE